MRWTRRTYAVTRLSLIKETHFNDVGRVASVGWRGSGLQDTGQADPTALNASLPSKKAHKWERVSRHKELVTSKGRLSNFTLAPVSALSMETTKMRTFLFCFCSVSVSGHTRRWEFAIYFP